jgi:hypothetical protein
VSVTVAVRGGVSVAVIVGVSVGVAAGTSVGVSVGVTVGVASCANSAGLVNNNTSKKTQRTNEV